MDQISNEQLLKVAKDALVNAYAPYSEFKVGAAILTKDGEVFVGCNVENASYGASICAERTAAVKAVSSGHRDFCKVAVVSTSEKFTFPCGICRQFLSEFMKVGSIVLEDKEMGIREYDISELMPEMFEL